MYLKKIIDKNEIDIKQLAAFSGESFDFQSLNDFVVIDVNDTAESIALAEEKNDNNEYYTKINLKGCFKCDGVEIIVRGVIDGVKIENDSYTVDTAKSIKFPLKYLTEKMYTPWLLPVKCAAYLLCQARKLDKIKIRLICVHPETLEKSKLEFTYTKDALETLFSSLLAEFCKWSRLYTNHIRERRNSLEALNFPFGKIRDGQDTIIKETRLAIKDKRSLYINAPTGIGKTTAVLYPALKALGEDEGKRIFYLTSKNSLHNVVFDAVSKMERAGGKIRVLSIVSKSKLCHYEKCEKKKCQLLKNQNERLKNALLDLIENEYYLSSDVLVRYAEKYSVCPFELTMRASLFSDVVVCDYNYIFDPTVSQLEIFRSIGEDIILIDEAHNLVERVKQMYSAFVDLQEIKQLAKSCENIDTDFYNACKRFCKFIKKAQENDLFHSEPLDKNSVDDIVIETNSFFEAFQNFILHNNSEATADANKIFTSLKKFISLCGSLNSDYISFFDELGRIRVMLADTGNLIKKIIKKTGCAIFFSATLAPEEYYRHMLGSKKKDVYINLSSPFPRENFKVVSYGLSTKYSERISTLEAVAEAIYSSVKHKIANYMVFLPSYSYLNEVSAFFSRRYPEVHIECEKPQMTQLEKNNFLKNFEINGDTTFVAFAVMGGSFSEGVDLAGDMLSGVIIIGLGVLPPERSRELTAAFFNDRFFDGTKFAYMYPGMNKVFQAGGRVIRNESDKGFLVIVDDRFLSEGYVEFLPESWSNISRAKSNKSINDILSDFWQK